MSSASSIMRIIACILEQAESELQTNPDDKRLQHLRTGVRSKIILLGEKKQVSISDFITATKE